MMVALYSAKKGASISSILLIQGSLERKMFHKSVLIVFAISLALTLSNEAWAEKRIALVIGNGAYPNIGELANPSNDARLMADTLRQLGFEVIEKVNVSQKPMKKAIKAFGNRLNRAGKDAIGLFYYAGHGVQVNGENYLIPVNVEIIDEADVDIEAVGMRAILQNMEYAGNDMNIIVMDACRNNPFKRGFRSASRGLARMDASKGTLIAYATAPGDVALDGKGENSPYTEALTANMLKPGVTVERMFKDVRNAVVEKTKSAQIPWESSSLTGGDFFFHPAEVIAATPSSTEATNKDFELLFWQSVLNSNSPADYEVYLSQYPNGVFAALAKVKIARLNSSVETSLIEAPVAASVDRAPSQGIIMFTKEETIALISGKTAVWEDYNGVYYAPDGKLFTVWDGEKETGKWEVTDEGAVCWLVPSWGNEPCESYYMGPEGLMTIYKGKESAASEHRIGDVLDSL